ncbi:C-C motif chemokine 5 isoform X1 [Bubalus bubalis]|uniref:C-C motif chemokine 5 isoform X1 n=1 Tax=Bubalus bubalis TaxID=89462 RepID=UPI001E1B8DD5|nr:C-C motif chemokine 5 isoform X1 [Bubalus bubalis]
MISAAVCGCYLETPQAGAPRPPACLPIKGCLAPCKGPAGAAEDQHADRPASAHSYHEGLRRCPRCPPDGGRPLRSCVCLPIFITRKNRQVCANPEKKWVREYINALELS